MAGSPTPKIHGASIVMLGAFNPAIFHPVWFQKFELLPEEELSSVSNLLVLPDLAQFSLDWLDLNVSGDRFQAASARPESFNLLRDIAISTFRILHHTPIRAIGVNTDLHFELNSEERWHEIEHTLVPKDRWNSVLVQPEMRALTLQGQRPDEYSGYIQVRIEPSVRVHPGIYIGVNDHFQFVGDQASDTEVPDSAPAIEVLESQWDNILKRVPPFINAVLGKGG